MHELDREQGSHRTMGRIHAQDRGAKLLGEVRRILGLEKPREHGLELTLNVRTTTVVTNRREMPRYPDRHQKSGSPPSQRPGPTA